MNRRSLLATAALSSLALAGLAQDRENDPSSFIWNPALSPAGPVLVWVNLKTQTAAVYRDGIEIGSCLVSTGRPGFETPTGVFHILEKDADHHSSQYNNASMPYTERLTSGGVALHAGGLPGYPSSHGCIHLPYEFSKRLFSITELGATVIITNDAETGGVSSDHRIEFTEHDSSDFHWAPHDSPHGPVAVLYSSADGQLEIIRNGVLIGKGPASFKALAPKPEGTYTYVLDGWSKDPLGKEVHPSWHQVSGPANSREVKAFSHIQTDPRLAHVLEAVLAPGAVLVITKDPISKATRSQPGFQIMSGQLASAK
jgi:hypothetical protein